MIKHAKSGFYLMLLSFFCWVLPKISIAQTVNISLDIGASDVAQTLDPYQIGNATYGATLNPQNITGDVTWEIIDASSLSSAGLEMQLNGSAFTSGTRTVTPDGTLEDITFELSGTPIIDAIGYTITLEVTDNDGPTVEVEITIPVIRQPVSVLFVLDRSGSMGWAPHGGAGTIDRMDILQNAASLFINKLDAFNTSGDEVGLTYFATVVDNPPLSFGHNLTAIDGNASNFIDEIEDLMPNGGTNMGGGLLAGRDKLIASGADNRQLIFLFTDGEQNGSTLVNDAGTEAGGQSLNDTDGDIQIVTIGTGAAAGMAAANRLQAIAEENTGTSDPPTARYFLIQEEVDATGNGADFNTTTGIVNFFDTGFEAMLSGSSPQTVGVESGTGSGQPISFEINDNIKKILFELITADQEPFFSVQKDGANISAVNYIYGPNNGTNSLLAVLDLSDGPLAGIDSEGTWTIVVQSGTGANTPYQLKAQVDDHLLNYTFEVEADDFKVEDALRFRANLSYHNQPIEDGTFSVLVLKPGEDLGDILAKADVRYDPTSAPESGTVGYQKLLAAIEGNSDLINALKLQENIIELTHTAEGNYEGQFTDTDVSGVYQVIANISASNDSIGAIRRLIRRTAYLRFGDPDPDLSNQEHSLIANPDVSQVQLLYTPAYSAGGRTRLVGPGFAPGLQVTGTGISNVSKEDNGDGSYTITFVVPNNNQDPNIKIDLSGVTIYEGQASKFELSSNFLDDIIDWWTGLGLPLWLFIVLLLVLLVLIILLLIRVLRR